MELLERLLAFGRQMGWHTHALYLVALDFVEDQALSSKWRMDLKVIAKLEGMDPTRPFPSLSTPTKTELVCYFITNEGRAEAFLAYLDRLSAEWSQIWA